MSRLEPRFRGGSGPPLVLLHAGFTSWQLWTPMLGLLTPTRDVLAPSMLGHFGGPPLPAGGGFELSNAIDLLEGELDDAGFDRPDVVGNSIGGWAALELARRGRARSVIAIGPMGMQTAAQGATIERHLSKQHARARRTRLLDGLLRIPAVRRQAMRDLSPSGHHVPIEVARDVAAATRAADVPRFFNSVRLPDGTMPNIERPEEIRTPVLLIWGTKDTLATGDQMQRYLAALPDARLVEIDGAGHCPQVDHPERVAREIIDFTRTVVDP